MALKWYFSLLYCVIDLKDNFKEKTIIFITKKHNILIYQAEHNSGVTNSSLITTDPDRAWL